MIPGRPAKAAAFAILAGVCLLALGAAELKIPPSPDRWVTDTAGFLTPAAVQELDQRLEAYERATGHQIIVYIGKTTGGYPIEEFAVKTFEAWKVGRQGLDDGLVLFIMAEDKKIRIEVGYGLEGTVPDIIAGRIINDIMVPKIRARGPGRCGAGGGRGRHPDDLGHAAGGRARAGARKPRHRIQGKAHRRDDLRHHRRHFFPDPFHHQPLAGFLAALQYPERRSGRGWRGRTRRRLRRRGRPVGRRAAPRAVGREGRTMGIMHRRKLLRQLDIERIGKAIADAEKETSGEIRVSVSRFFWGRVRPAAERAFRRLGMTHTKDRNGILFFFVPSRRRFVVLGDEGIHAKVGQDFWEGIAAAMSADFRKGDFTDGLVRGIAKAAQGLAAHFPCHAATDVNELPDDIDFNETGD